jgi:hypothetical protein
MAVTKKETYNSTGQHMGKFIRQSPSSHTLNAESSSIEVVGVLAGRTSQPNCH